MGGASLETFSGEALYDVILTLDALGPGLGGGDGLRENELRKGCINLLFVFK